MVYLVAYDISNNKKRTKLAKELEKAGGLRVQKSVFEIELKKEKLRKLKPKLHRFRGGGDSIRYYAQCQSCLARLHADESKELRERFPDGPVEEI